MGSSKLFVPKTYSYISSAPMIKPDLGIHLRKNVFTIYIDLYQELLIYTFIRDSMTMAL